jgi:PAS domain S-box-containing protein
MLVSEDAFAVLARLERPAILALDEDASICFWNGGAEVLYGWTAEEALGRRLTWLMPDDPGNSALVRAELAAVRMTGSGERTERRRRADGAAVRVTVRKMAGAGCSVWEFSEIGDAASPGLEASVAGVQELIGSDVLVFDAQGTLTECSPPDTRARLSDGEIERARTLALRALRIGRSCESLGTAISPWIRACLLGNEGGSSVLVLVRSALGVVECGESEMGRLTVLCRSLLEAQEAERRRLARELHDDLGQSLTGLLYALESEKTPREELRREAAALLAKVRGLSQGLRPGILDDLGLAAALRWLADQHGRTTGMQVAIAMEGGNKRWPAELETALFRIAQEAMTNAARHAAAKSIEIAVDERSGELQMSVSDDGIGFDASGVACASTGLASMRERTLLLGGRFELDTELGRGTRIWVCLPLLWEAAG